MSDLNDESFVQRWFILPKLLYFWLSMAIYSATGAFGNLLKDRWGFTYSQIGFIFALQGINFVGAIVWTGLADRTGKQKWLLAGATTMSALAFLINNLPKLLKFTLTYDLAYSLVVLGISWFFQSAMFPLVDGAVIGMMSKNPKFTKDQFGYQRLFGSPAHVIGTVLGGFCQLFGENSVYLYQLNAFICATVFIILVLIAVPNVSEPVPKSFAHHGHHEKGKPAHISQATALPLAPSPVVPAAPEIDTTSTNKQSSPLVRLLTDVSFLFFMLFVISAGLLSNTLTIYQQLYVAKDKSSPFFAALTRIPAAISEIAVFLSAKHVTKVLGIYWLLIFSQIAGLLRIFGYALINENTFFPYILEVSKGLNSGFIVSAGVRIASDIAPPGCSSTAQGLFSGTYKGISIMLAGIIGGTLLHFLNQDIQRLFLIIGITSSCLTFAFFIKFLFFDRVIGFPGFPRREKVPVVKHNTASTSSFGSTVSSDSKEAASPKV